MHKQKKQKQPTKFYEVTVKNASKQNCPKKNGDERNEKNSVKLSS